MQQKLNVQIIGGCMLGQRALGLSNLFYRKFSAMLQDQHGIQCNFQLAGHNDFEMLPQQAQALANTPHVPQLLIIQLRPGLIFRRCNLLVPARGKGKWPFQLNPFVTGKNTTNISTDAITIDENEVGEAHGESTLNKMIATINALAGMAMGYHKKGAQQIVDLLTQTSVICAQKNIRLVVIGCINSYRISLLRKQYVAVNHLLKNGASKNGITYVDVFELMEQQERSGIAVFLEDHYHLNVAGHAIVAEALFQQTAGELNDWLRKAAI